MPLTERPAVSAPEDGPPSGNPISADGPEGLGTRTRAAVVVIGLAVLVALALTVQAKKQ